MIQIEIKNRMNTKSAFLILMCLILGSTVAVAQQIEFAIGTWQEVKQKAVKEKKPIFVDAYTVWCGPCKKMAAEVFTDPAVGKYYNETFVNYKMDMEKGEGVEFAKTYGVTAFPTFLYFDKKGELVNKSIGYKSADAFVKSAKDAFNPANQPSVFKEAFEKSDKSLKAVLEYSAQLSKIGDGKLAQELALEYLSKAKLGEKYSKEAITILKRYMNDYSSPLFKDFLINKDKYQSVMGAGEVDKYIDFILSNPSFIRGDNPNVKADLASYTTILKSYDRFVGTDYYIARAQYFTHLKNDDDDMFFYAKNFLDKEYKIAVDDSKRYYFLVYMANKYVDKDGERLDAANRWVRKSIQLKDNQYTSKFVLAQLLYREGKYKAALPLAEQALLLEKDVVEAGLMKNLFKAKTIPAFIEKIKANL